jgi:nucleoside-diphosphate-sugar epimerase
VAAILGTDVEPTYQDARAGDVRHSQADIGLARQLLGYEPAVGFEDGLRRTIAWYRDSRRG